MIHLAHMQTSPHINDNNITLRTIYLILINDAQTEQ